MTSFETNYRLLSETAFIKHMITNVYPKGIVSLVSDSFDYWSVLSDSLPRLKKVIMSRDGKTVVRPDSGSPVEVICGKPVRTYSSIEQAIQEHGDVAKFKINEEVLHVGGRPHKYVDRIRVDKDGLVVYWDLTCSYEAQQGVATRVWISDWNVAIPEPAEMGTLDVLWQTFGGTINSKGYKVLDSHIGTIYGDSITLERAKAILEGLKAKGFASSNITFGVGSYCVHPETLILCADLIWRRAGDLKVGQEIIAFDEDPNFDNGRHATRRFRKATIEYNNPGTKLSTQISTDIGPDITASDDHPWLVYAPSRRKNNVFFDPNKAQSSKDFPRNPGLVWKRTYELEVGDQIAYLCDPWETDNTREGGWLAGMFDGEGGLGVCNTGDRIPSWKVSISQNQTPTLERIKARLDDREFTYYRLDRKCEHVILTGGWVETLRFLGQVRPERLLEKIDAITAEMPALARGRTYQLATITSINPVGKQPIAGIQTSCGTFITNGYLSHNTYQMVTRDTFGFAVKSTAGIVNGEFREIFKDPATDSGTKKSARGYTKVVLDENGDYRLVDRCASINEPDDQMREVFRDGRLLIDETFAEIRRRAQS